MKNTQTKRKKKALRAFQPWPENQQRLELASRMGMNVSELINAALRDRLDVVLTERANNVQRELKGMVRGAGFEPATPTVSR